LRHRLRFHLQEVDLTDDVVVVGRGSACTMTIDDPMLSREHIRIDLSGPEPTIEDLRSRNGTQLNGRPLVGQAILKDGDRIRIGTQELVFLIPGAAKRNFRTTSGLTLCGGCSIPYPSSSAQCPHCGAVSSEQASKSSAHEVPASGWTFDLLCQVVDRAIEQGRLADAERMMERGVPELEEQLDANVEIEPSRVVRVAACAVSLGCALRSPRWLETGARLYGRVREAPSVEVLALVDRLPADPHLAAAIRAFRDAGPENRRAS